MKQVIDTNELVQRFNDDEAVWQRYDYRRHLRRLPTSHAPLPYEMLDWLDWLEAERECRQIRAIGVIIPLQP